MLLYWRRICTCVQFFVTGKGIRHLTSRTRFLLICIEIIIVFQPPAAAAGEINLEALYRLEQKQQQQIETQQKQIEALRKLVEAQKHRIKTFHEKTSKTLRKVVKATKKQGRFRISSKKGFKIKDRKTGSTLRIGGRLQMDQAFYNEDVTRLGSGAQFRRARLFVAGRIFHDWKFKSEIEFGEKGQVGPRNLWLKYKGLKPVTLTLGNFQEPFSLEGLTSSNFITFMERALPYAFTPDYHLGIGVSGHYGFGSLAVGVFGETIGKKNDKVDDGWGVASRLTFAPVREQERVLHLGFSTEYRQPKSDNIVRFRARPESNVTNQRLVDTRKISGVDSTLKVDAELAGVYGPFSLQSEYMHVFVRRKAAADLNFVSWYLYGSWFPTGESRSYNWKTGNFSRIHPLHSWGAWELGLRYSALDLSDQDIQGGKENDITIGLNWYLNPYIRFMANYILVDAGPNKNSLNESPRIFQLRGQVDF